MESAGAMHVKMQENMQYVFHDICHNVFLRLVVPREKLERHRLMKIYIYREPINILEELQMHQALVTVIPNIPMLRLARENLIKRARLFLQMKGGDFEHLL
jgi:hypothetical protein